MGMEKKPRLPSLELTEGPNGRTLSFYDRGYW
ncbi:hypothetical protein QFZ49_008064 [Streptomyces turgidiscabies]|uniref:Uncharacterized protein n=1 Tax=Streptomyces turgidiscabies TaxID=85558 RepID=A0ABU0S1F2_9ACTN|nr:hypothetical protein [Streptomyces turgidiscabies]